MYWAWYQIIDTQDAKATKTVPLGSSKKRYPLNEDISLFYGRGKPCRRDNVCTDIDGNLKPVAEFLEYSRNLQEERINELVGKY